MAFHVRRPGTYSLLIDAGRPGWQHKGAPRGGPADRTAWQLGNLLLGNDPHAAALEITLHGPTLEATARHRLVVYGPIFATRLRRASSHLAEEVPSGHTFTVEPGDEVQLAGLSGQEGIRAYLCVEGGFHAEPILGSLTALEPLKAGD